MDVTVSPTLNAIKSRLTNLENSTVGVVDYLYNVKASAIAAPSDGVTDARTALNTLINTTLQATGAGGEVFFPEGTYLINSNMTIPANVKVTFTKGAMLKIATGVTVTIQGVLSAGIHQIFSFVGTGQVNLSQARVSQYYPDWFAPANTTNWAAAIELASEMCHKAGGGTVEFPSGKTYTITGKINLDGWYAIRWKGHNVDQVDGIPTILYTGAGDGVVLSLRSTQGFVMDGIWLRYDNPGFTGTLVGMAHQPVAVGTRGGQSDSAYISLNRCAFTGKGSVNAYNAKALLSLDRAIIYEIVKCHFIDAAIGIIGVDRHQRDFVAANVESGNVIKMTDHFYRTGYRLNLGTTGTLPSGLTAGNYWAIRVDDDHIKLATSEVNANAGTAVTFTAGAGSGRFYEADAGGKYCYVADIHGNSFNGVQLDILNPSANWDIRLNTFEPNRDNKLLVIDTDIAGYYNRNIVFSNNYLGDVGAQTEAVVTFRGALGLVISSNWFYLATGATAIALDYCDGVEIKGNRIEGGATAVKYINTNNTNVVIGPNSIQMLNLTATANGGGVSNQFIISENKNAFNGGLAISGSLTQSNSAGVDIGYITSLSGSNSSAAIGVADSSTGLPNRSMLIQGTNQGAPIVFATQGSPIGATFVDADVNLTTNTITKNAHGMANGQLVEIASNGGGSALPTPFTNYQRLYIVNTTTNTFQLSLTLGGAAVDITALNNGAALHTIYKILGVERLRVDQNGVVAAVDMEVTDNAKGLILKSPDGTRYRVKIANGGTLTIAAA